VKLPPEVAVDDRALQTIAARHGFGAHVARRLPSGGIINTVFAFGDRFVLRVPRQHPAHIAQLHLDVAAIPLAVAAGVRTPALVAFDDSEEVLPVPFVIVEHVAGRDLESLRADPAEVADVWREVGSDLGRLHAGVDVAAWPGGASNAETDIDVAALIDQRVDEGWLSYVEARWLGAWVERVGGPGRTRHPTATHGDVQMSNVLVGDDGRYLALLDWGCAATRDPVVDFMPMPMVAVPFLLEGHRAVAPLPDDDDAERRILLGRLQTLLAVMPRGAAPGMTWGERPTAWLADVLRFFADPPPRWRDLSPR
jgi:aminoglycoside phosphotransferase (APT) family kinase protein